MIASLLFLLEIYFGYAISAALMAKLIKNAKHFRALIHHHLGEAYLAFGLLLTYGVLFTRVLGINVDETNYIRYAFTNGMGDARTSGKPWLFYQLNFIVMNTLGWLFFPVRPLILYLFYVAWNVVGLCWLTQSLPVSKSRRWIFFLFLLLSPFFLQNSTQLMMETPVLGLLAVAFGGLIRLESSQCKTLPKISFYATVAALLMKETVYPAVFVLLIAFWIPLKKQVTSFAKAIALALLIRLISYSVMRIEIDRTYTDTDHLFSIPALLLRWGLMTPYLKAWEFFLWEPALIVTLILAIVAISKDNLRKAFPWYLVVLILLSLAGVGAIVFVSNAFFTRYAYPEIWVGLMAIAVIIAYRAPVVMGGLLVTSLLIPTGNMWFPKNDRLSLWPYAVTSETYNQGSIVLAGAPIHGWFIFRGWWQRPFCIWAPQAGSEASEWMEKFFRDLDPNAQILDEKQPADFQSCKGSPIIARRQYQTSLPNCSPECPHSLFNSTFCTFQKLQKWAKPESAYTHWTCLP